MVAPPKPLSNEQVRQELKSLSGWTGDEHGLKKSLVFEDFRGAMRFMQACVDGIEEQNHHPVWSNKYNSIDIHLDTFDIGHMVTQKDVDLARFFDSVLAANEFGYVPD